MGLDQTFIIERREANRREEKREDEHVKTDEHGSCSRPLQCVVEKGDPGTTIPSWQSSHLFTAPAHGLLSSNMPSCFAPFNLRHTTPERWSEGKDAGVVGRVMNEEKD